MSVDEVSLNGRDRGRVHLHEGGGGDGLGRSLALNDSDGVVDSLGGMDVNSSGNIVKDGS